MKSQIFSFDCALRGIWSAICSEGHLRFHITAGFYVFLFSVFYGLSAAQYAVLILLITSVIASEIFNTAVENMCDLVTRENNEVIRLVKDMSAGAVLLLSVAAAATVVLFFWDIHTIIKIIKFFADNLICAILLAFSAVISFFFIWLGPKGMKHSQ